MTANRFKSWLAQRPAAPPLGTWIMSAAPAAAEALGFCGFDFLVIDMEHSPLGIADTISLLRTIAGTPAEALVRLAWNDRILVKQVLDAGARTVVFPFIETAEEARTAVSFTRYPPQGVRGVAATHRASRFGRVQDYLGTANQDIAVVIQLETPAAIGRLAEIAAVPGVDSLFLGPADLSAAMGYIGNIGHVEVQAQILETARLAHAAGKPIGILGSNPDFVGRYFQYGYDWAALSSDMAMLTGRAVDWITALNRRPRPAGSPE